MKREGERGGEGGRDEEGKKGGRERGRKESYANLILQIWRIWTKVSKSSASLCNLSELCNYFLFKSADRVKLSSPFK